AQRLGALEQVHRPRPAQAQQVDQVLRVLVHRVATPSSRATPGGAPHPRGHVRRPLTRRPAAPPRLRAGTPGSAATTSGPPPPRPPRRPAPGPAPRPLRRTRGAAG